jgi:acylpyruvate hydrolase
VRLGTLRTPQGTIAIRQDRDVLVSIEGYADLGTLLRNPQWQQIAAAADGTRHEVGAADLAPVVPRPGKIICVGANYRSHILEMGGALPEHPTLFAKFAESLIGDGDRIELPAEDTEIDWEAELAIVIGAPGRRIRPEDALSHVAGYTVMNDVSMRGYQFRTNQWLQGKTWDNSTPLGPVMVTRDEFDASSAAIRTRVNGEVVQESTTEDLLFGPREIIAYVSTITTLAPGDIIATGTPDGVGFARTPQRFLTEGDVVETVIDGLGSLRNVAACREIVASA